MKAYYFGTDGSPGHYLWGQNMARVRSFDLREIPWGVRIDGGLLDKTKQQVQGHCVLSQKDGWTAISFWDRTGDKRQGSNSAFILEKVATFEEMLDAFATYFPRVLARLNFSLVAPAA